MVESLGWLNQNQTDKLNPTRTGVPFPLTFPIIFPAVNVLAINQEDKLTELPRGA